MYRFDHILVCLDFTQMDDALMRYSNFITETLQPKRVSFLHVMQEHGIPRKILTKLPSLDQPLPVLVKEEIDRKFEQLVDQKKGVEYEVLVKEGYTTPTILEFTRDEEVRLTLMGKKIGYKGEGNIVRKIASLTPSSVLLVTEKTVPELKKIHVRMNFNRSSEIALKTAVRLSEYTGARVACHNVFRFPIKYFAQPEFVSAGKFAEIEHELKQHNSKEYQHLIKHLKLEAQNIPCQYTFDKENDEAQELFNFAVKDDADLIVIGSKIKSELNEIILDRTSEKLVGVGKDIPVLIVKDRKPVLGFLENLFG